ncbi:hypothetical protein ACFO4E_05285 [Nocardiopsis mangrovi]|uniref:Uncharacterized protein n=1 Tax=Nocardiopsis mangrovi TaxID=1179818 RepID=A0ABV9DQT9_9ACTN
MSAPDDDRRVEFFDDGPDILPDTTADEHGAGWGESPADDDNTARLLEDRPPHWG